MASGWASGPRSHPWTQGDEVRSRPSFLLGGPTARWSFQAPGAGLPGPPATLRPRQGPAAPASDPARAPALHLSAGAGAEGSQGRPSPAHPAQAPGPQGTCFAGLTRFELGPGARRRAPPTPTPGARPPREGAEEGGGRGGRRRWTQERSDSGLPSPREAPVALRSGSAAGPRAVAGLFLEPQPSLPSLSDLRFASVSGRREPPRTQRRDPPPY